MLSFLFFSLLLVPHVFLQTEHAKQFLGKWKPQIALINPRIRVSAFIRQAAASFGRMRLLGKQAEDAAYYSFFLSIMLQYQLPDGTSKRQIRVEQTTGEDVFVVMESEFISIV